MIGILGAYGDIGVHVIRVLHKLGVKDIKGCGRDISKVNDALLEEFPFVKWEKADVSDQGQLLDFVRGCDVVVNCTPSYKMSGIIADSLSDSECRFVDAGFCEDFYDTYVNRGNTKIFASGSTPGFSMILCRYLASHFKKTASIRYTFGALDKLEYGAARDYIEGIGGVRNLPLSAYINGVKTQNSVKREHQTEVPMFPRRVDLCPFTDSETDLIMKYTGARDGVFQIALDGKFIPAELNKIRLKYDKSPENAVRDLMNVSKLEMTDKTSYIRFLIEITGDTENGRESKTLYFMNESSAQLTASVAACTAYLTFKGKMADGFYPCGCAENYKEILDMVTEVCDESVFQIISGNAEMLSEVFEGEL